MCRAFFVPLPPLPAWVFIYHAALVFELGRFMGYNDDASFQPALEPEPLSVMETLLGVVVRAVGLVVLVVGLWVGVKVVFEAWALYQDPQRIESFAQAVDAGSNLDGMVAGLARSVGAPAPADGQAGGGGSLRLSYFAAWFIALLLMFVVGSLAMAAITTGGQLALYDLQFRRYSRHVLKEMRALQRRG